jgi:serine/threonine protein phosphatase PrpC
MVVPVMPYKVSAFGISDIGLVRQNNEDCWASLDEVSFFALADGMGGHRAGEVAAKLAIDTLCEVINSAYSGNVEDLSFEEAHGVMQLAIEQTNRAVYDKAHTREEYKGMGTTLCCLQFHPQGLIFGHVGDSRIYRFRNKRLEQITRDHSLLRELVDLGQLNERQAEEFVYKNIITRAVGTESDIDPSVHMADLQNHDIYMMCSDGLSDMLSVAEMEHILNHSKTIQDAGKRLVINAKEKGGYDNVTVVVMQVNKTHGSKDIF